MEDNCYCYLPCKLRTKSKFLHGNWHAHSKLESWLERKSACGCNSGSCMSCLENTAVWPMLFLQVTMHDQLLLKLKRFQSISHRAWWSFPMLSLHWLKLRQAHLHSQANSNKIGSLFLSNPLNRG